MDTKTIQRRYDLDWLRVLAILSVFIYHTTRFFHSEDWIVKNPTRYPVMDVVETTLANWILALIFAISGASLFYALGKGGAGSFIKDKVLRLLVPLVTMGIFIFGALQIYLDRLTHGEFGGSFLAFVPHYLQPANLAWGGVHLWYLEMLFVFCLVFLPLLLWLKRGSGRRPLARLGDLLALRGALYLLALPTILCLVLTSGESVLGNTDWGGGSILTHATFFLSGFLIISHEGLQENIRRFRRLSLGLALLLMATLFALLVTIGEQPSGTPLYALGRALWGLWSWCWVLAILGFGIKRLDVSKPFLTYANEAVLPFYILHQPVLLCVGYTVVRWNLPAVLKFAIIDAVSLAIIMALYHFVVRQFNLIRVLFGIKWLVRAPVARVREARPA